MMKPKSRTKQVPIDEDNQELLVKSEQINEVKPEKKKPPKKVKEKEIKWTKIKIGDDEN